MGFRDGEKNEVHFLVCDMCYAIQRSLIYRKCIAHIIKSANVVVIYVIALYIFQNFNNFHCLTRNLLKTL